MRFATLLIIVIVLGLITGNVAEASYVCFAAAFVLAADQLRSNGPRTRFLLTVSILYALIFAIGMVISISGNLVVPLSGLGLFIISYFAVYPKTFGIVLFASLMFIIAIPFQGATLALVGQNFLLIFVGGLWATVGGIIFLPRKNPKQQCTVTADPIQEQPQPHLTWQDRFRPLTSNLSVHSQYFQYSIVFAITGAVGMLIVQWFKLSDGDWVLTTVVTILAPAFSDISFTLKRRREEVYQEGLLRVVHRIIGTIIGAVIALIIIDNVHNIWLLSLILFVFLSSYLSFVKIKNYAFRTIFATGMALLFLESIYPTTDPTAAPLERLQNVFIGCLLSLVASRIWFAFRRKKSDLPLGRKGE